MKLRLAEMADLPQLKAVYKEIAFTYSRKKRILFPHLPCAVQPLALTV